MKSYKIHVEDFGLIKSADITMKPLTIFLGENNTGKSYIAQLVYALTRSISHRGVSKLLYAHPYFSRDVMESEKQKYKDRTVAAFRRRLPSSWEGNIVKRRRLDYEIPFRYLPRAIADECEKNFQKYISSMPKYLEEELIDAYGVRIKELSAKLGQGSNFKIDIESEKPKLRIKLGADKNQLRSIGEIGYSFKETKIKTVINPYSYYSLIFRRREIPTEQKLQYLIDLTIRSSIDIFTDIFPEHAYYFPAARSGILQGQKLIARAGLRSLKRAGLESISMSKLPGVVVDFLDQIYSIDKDEHSSMEDLSKEIENKLASGAIGLIERKEELPEIYFNVKNAGRFPLHRTSSMVSELAPVILMLRYLIEKGDIIILEEPESHLHPKLQIEFAKIVADFIRRGLNVLITTHSDYFVEQLSNIIALSSKSEDIKSKLGYQGSSLIYKNEVAAYRFLHGAKGYTNINRLKVDESGISEAGFGEIAESLYEESIEAKRAE